MLLVSLQRHASRWTPRCLTCFDASKIRARGGCPHLPRDAPRHPTIHLLDTSCRPRICCWPMDRRTFLQGTATTAAALAIPHTTKAAVVTDERDFEPIWAQITKQHDESVRRLQEWIHQPSIAAENRGVSEGCDLTMQLLREAGFDHATRVPTDGQPGIFATLDAGAPRTIGLYFMYDGQQVGPAD